MSVDCVLLLFSVSGHTATKEPMLCDYFIIQVSSPARPQVRYHPWFTFGLGSLHSICISLQDWTSPLLSHVIIRFLFFFLLELSALLLLLRETL